MELTPTYLKISKLIAAEMNKTISVQEQEILNNWLTESEENQKIYEGILMTDWFADQLHATSNYDTKEAWALFDKGVQRKTSLRNLYYKLSKVAAIIVLFFSTFFILQNYLVENSQKQAVQPLIQPGIRGAKLIMDNGEQISLTADNSFTLLEKDGTKINKEQGSINYADKHILPEKEKEIFNTIKTSKGEEFSLTLSDGTKVYLNAQSEIKFPVRFIKNERIVELSGEAYFEVARDTEMPFKVLTGKSVVKVLGTTFNIKSYDDEYFEKTTLVEGSVSIQHRYDDASVLELKPGDQASIQDVNHRIQVQKVESGIYTAWKDGRFVFKNQSLENIIKDLKRWYDFEVEFGDEAAKDVLFGARINRYDEVNGIFNIMTQTNLVNIKQEGKKFTISVNK